MTGRGLLSVRLLVMGCLLYACASSPRRGANDPLVSSVVTRPDRGPVEPTRPDPSATGAPATTLAPPADPAAPPAGPVPAFTFEATTLTPAIRARMTGPAWRPGCPVSLDDLRTVHLTFWGFDGVEHEGTLVVNADALATLQGVFAELHAARWPIRQIKPIEEYGGDDNASMDADNTSAFNCRPAAGSSSTWSQHAYGRAVDVNPRENPYVTPKGVEPKAGEAFLDRDAATPGLIRDTSIIATSFDRRGWGWGGRWSATKDYQHFSSNGR